MPKKTQKARTLRKVKAAAKLLQIDLGTRTQGDQQDIVAYIRSKNGMQKAVDTLFECLAAKRTYYDLYAKQMVTEPDSATRRAAAMNIIAQEIGEPIKRQQILIGTVESEDQLMQKLMESPALCQRVLTVLENVMAKRDQVMLTNSAQNP
jgi:hypothetical protein